MGGATRFFGRLATILRLRRSKKRICMVFANNVDMEKVYKLGPHVVRAVIQALLTPEPRNFRLVIEEAKECHIDCDGDEELPPRPWECKKLRLCPEGYTVERVWTT